MIGLSYMEKGDVPSALEHKLGLQALQRSEREWARALLRDGRGLRGRRRPARGALLFPEGRQARPELPQRAPARPAAQGALHGVPEGHRPPARDEIDRKFDLLKGVARV